jgi:N-methylhydantoinase A
MIAFGGAGPVHAYNLARLLKLGRLIVPLGAGVTSALGFLVAAPAIDYVRSYVSRLEQIDWTHLNALFDEMEAEAKALLVEAGAKADEITFTRSADMRHIGQGFEISVPVPNGTLGAEATDPLRESFFDAYHQLFERTVREVPIEALNWRLAASAPVPNIALNFGGQPVGTGEMLKGHRDVYFGETGFAPCQVIDRYALKPGDTFEGPAVVEERESTTVVGPGATVEVDQYHNLVINLPG